MQRLMPDVLGLSLSRSAPAWLRERAPAGPGSRRALLDGLAGFAPERLVLHTCERLELYLAAKGGEASVFVLPLAGWLRVPADVLATHVEVYRDDAVTSHLFRVTAGLESRLIGEPQIRGQVRQAFAEAREAGALGPFLDALCRAALHTGRLVHRETALGRGTSLVDLTLGRLRDELGTVRARSVVVAGTGRLAAEVAAALSGAEARVFVASRHLERAQALAARFSADSLAHSDLVPALARADALVACSQGLLPIASLRRPLAVVDLGMPANVPPHLATAPGIRLTRLEDFTGIAAGPEVAKALAIVAHEAERFRLWRARRPRITRPPAEAAA